MTSSSKNWKKETTSWWVNTAPLWRLQLGVTSHVRPCMLCGHAANKHASVHPHVHTSGHTCVCTSVHTVQRFIRTSTRTSVKFSTSERSGFCSRDCKTPFSGRRSERVCVLNEFQKSRYWFEPFSMNFTVSVPSRDPFLGNDNEGLATRLVLSGCLSSARRRPRETAPETFSAHHLGRR